MCLRPLPVSLGGAHPKSAANLTPQRCCLCLCSTPAAVASGASVSVVCSPRPGTSWPSSFSVTTTASDPTGCVAAAIDTRTISVASNPTVTVTPLTATRPCYTAASFTQSFRVSASPCSGSCLALSASANSAGVSCSVPSPGRCGGNVCRLAAGSKAGRSSHCRPPAGHRPSLAAHQVLTRAVSAAPPVCACCLQPPRAQP